LAATSDGSKAVNGQLNGIVRQRLTAPRAAGVAGILFALLFGTSIVLMRTALDHHTDSATVWTSPEAVQIRFALGLMPYAGIAFLWFIGVIRDRLGELEDKFFATVFFGSGLVFIAMIFASSAIAGGILAAAQQLDANSAFEVTTFARAEMLEITNVYALRMAGVFMISLGTVWLRTKLMARWTVALTYILALSLLLMINLSLWVQLIFPAWTLLVSVVILIRSSRSEMHLTD
jgi:hypothetical protein